MKITKEPCILQYHYWNELEIGDFFDVAGITYQKISSITCLEYSISKNKCIVRRVPEDHPFDYNYDKSLLKLTLEHLILRIAVSHKE